MEETPRGAGRHEVARCPNCQRTIWSDHPYAWCSECGNALPADIQGRLATLQGVKELARASRAEDGEALVVEGREVPCPICGHGRFSTLNTVMSGRAAALFDMEWASPAAVNYICHRCGHVLWFMRR